MEEELEGTEPRLQLLYIHDSHIVDTDDMCGGNVIGQNAGTKERQNTIIPVCGSQSATWLLIRTHVC